MKYKRVLLKLSGEALMGELQYGIDPVMLKQYAQQIKEVADLGCEIAIVIGGGNIFRGVQGVASGMTVYKEIIWECLQPLLTVWLCKVFLEDEGVYTRLQTAIRMEQIAEPFIKRRATRHLEKGRVVIFGAGTGNPYFTTDTAAVLRAIEINADVILKGTRVDGIYTADPEKDPTAEKFTKISYHEVYEKDLKVMDMTAFTLSEENNLPIIVFDMNTSGNLKKLLIEGNVGTLVTNN